jgi:transposase
MKAEKKLIQQRLSVLQLAEALRNVSLACRQRGVSRSQFYEYKRRFQTHGLEGLKDLPPIAKSHPMTTPPQTVEKIKALAFKHPAWGCQRLEALLKADGISVSYVTIQKILDRNNLGSRYQRWLALEEKPPTKQLNSPLNRLPLSKNKIPASKNVMYRAKNPENYSIRTLSMSATLRASVRCISMRWSIPTPVTLSLSCILLSSLRLL